jgi:hypothetical protein
MNESDVVLGLGDRVLIVELSPDLEAAEKRGPGADRCFPDCRGCLKSVPYPRAPPISTGCGRATRQLPEALLS